MSYSPPATSVLCLLVLATLTACGEKGRQDQEPKPVTAHIRVDGMVESEGIT